MADRQLYNNRTLIKEGCGKMPIKLIDEEGEKIAATAFLAVFVWGLAAHAYGFLNLIISHDSIAEFFTSDAVMRWKVALGRFAEPIYLKVFHSGLALPWLNGVLTLIWLSVSVWLTARIFSIKDKIRIALIAGIFTVNITVTALAATYITDLDADIFAAMLNVCAVFLWERGGKTSWLGVLPLVLAMGLYQSMVSVAITLVIIVSILKLIQGEQALMVIRNGFQAIAMFLIAGMLYLLVTKLVCALTRIELASGYNGLTSLLEADGGILHFVRGIPFAYSSWLAVFSKSLRSPTEMLALHIFLAIPAVVVLLHLICTKRLPIPNKVLTIVLGMLLPLGMNISCVLDGGMVHDLMLYAAWLVYLLVLLLVSAYTDSALCSGILPKACQNVAVFVLILILLVDVQTANSAYVKKSLERQATLSIMTNVNAQMNGTAGYMPGESKVVFVGSPRTESNELFPYLSQITGLGYEAAITYEGVYTAYYKYVLQTALWQVSNDIPKEFTDPMPSFPQNGYIQWYNDVLVVKLSG